MQNHIQHVFGRAKVGNNCCTCSNAASKANSLRVACYVAITGMVAQVQNGCQKLSTCSKTHKESENSNQKPPVINVAHVCCGKEAAGKHRYPRDGANGGCNKRHDDGGAVAPKHKGKKRIPILDHVRTRRVPVLMGAVTRCKIFL